MRDMTASSESVLRHRGAFGRPVPSTFARGPDARPSRTKARPGVADREPPRARSGTTASHAPVFPALKEAFPLVFFGACCISLGLYFGLTGVSPFASRVPFWLFLLLMGGVAVGGGLLSSQIPDEVEEAVPEPVPEAEARSSSGNLPLEHWANRGEEPLEHWATQAAQPMEADAMAPPAPVWRVRPSPARPSSADEVEEVLSSLDEMAPPGTLESSEPLAPAAFDARPGRRTAPVDVEEGVEGPIDELMMQLERTESVLAAPASPRPGRMAKVGPLPVSCGGCRRALEPGEVRAECATCRAPLCAACTAGALRHEEKSYCPNCAWLEESLPPLGPHWRPPAAGESTAESNMAQAPVPPTDSRGSARSRARNWRRA